MLLHPEGIHPRKTRSLPQEESFVVAGPRESRLLRLWRYWKLTLGFHLFHHDYLLFKRLIDIVVSALLLICLLPLFAVAALLIKLTDGGSVFFWQKRVGRWSKEFAFPKFRSMVPNAEQLLPALLRQNDHGDDVKFKMKSDPRITWIGRILRKFSIDELPQLWCVLKGEMSLVGPRPPLPREVARYTLRERRRLDVVPGLTCIWQVSGRSLIPFPQQVELDIEYIEKRTLWFDFKLLLRTIPAVLFPKGAY
jgi:lipopolysaccharide/colanic/teichoic acid biosynthesis glycosyltransferase